MKKVIFILVVMLAMCVACGCNNRKVEEKTDVVDTTEVVDTTAVDTTLVQ